MIELLSPHISRAEFERSDTAIEHAIDNRMPDHFLTAARMLCVNVLEPIRDRFGVPIILNSGYRCEAVNRLLGSKDTSQHMRGEAGDIEMPHGPSNFDLATWIAGSTIDFDQLILEAYHQGQPRSGWVHVSRSLASRQRRQVLTMVMGSHGAVYLPGLHA